MSSSRRIPFAAHAMQQAPTFGQKAMSDNYPGAAVLRQQFAGALKATLAKPPVYAFCFFAILIVLASVWCFRSFNTWPDRYSAAGYYVSLFGFSYVMFELLRAKRLAEVAREHYDRAAGLMRTQHYQFCLQEAQNTWNVALIEWQNKQWTHASRSLSAPCQAPADSPVSAHPC